jgi:uncharacterized protein (DUF1778 family)
MAIATAPRGERLDARVTREEKEMIETAASLSGTSASDFIRMAALLNPPKPNEKAIAAARRLKEEIA